MGVADFTSFLVVCVMAVLMGMNINYSIFVHSFVNFLYDIQNINSGVFVEEKFGWSSVATALKCNLVWKFSKLETSEM